MFSKSAKKYPTSKCLGWRERDVKTNTWGPYVWMDYATVDKRRINFGAGLINLHHKVGDNRNTGIGIGLWSANRPEWQITDLAAAGRSCFTVSIYDTLGPSTTEYIINHAELTCVVTSLNVSSIDGGKYTRTLC